jgi:hypothetical protein
MRKFVKKYKDDLKRLGSKKKNIVEHENQVVEDLILKYYTTFEVSDSFIKELKFVLENVSEMSLRNKVLTSYFAEKYITGRFDAYGFKYEKVTFLV